MNGTRLWMFGGAVAILAVLAGGWFVGVDPLLAQAATSESELTSVQTLNAAQEAKIAELREASDRQESLDDERGELLAAIPATASMSAFLGELAKLAGESGVQITSLTANDAQLIADAAPAPAPAPAPEGDSAEAAADPADTEAAAAAGPTAGMVTVPVTLAATGSFEALTAFINKLQNADRLVSVGQLNMTGTTLTDGEAGGFTLDLTGSVFVQAGAAPAEEAAEAAPAA